MFVARPQIVRSILSGESRSGVGIIRPPGHHAECNEAYGFCLFNNTALAAKYAIEDHHLERCVNQVLTHLAPAFLSVQTDFFDFCRVLLGLVRFHSSVLILFYTILFYYFAHGFETHQIWPGLVV